MLFYDIISFSYRTDMLLYLKSAIAAAVFQGVIKISAVFFETIEILRSRPQNRY